MADDGVQPGGVDLAALDALFNEHPWWYQKTAAKAGKGDRVLAYTSSRNSIELTAPHSGGSSLHIKLEQTPGDRSTVYLSVANGETACDLLDGCEVILTLDGATVERFTADTAIADAATDLIISEPSRFIALIKASKSAAIALPIRGNGTKSFTFVTHSLSWPPEQEKL